jgi:hypothetical protein
MVVHVRRQLLQILLAAVHFHQLYQSLMAFVQVIFQSISIILKSFIYLIAPCPGVACNYGGFCSSSNATSFSCICPYSTPTSATNALCTGSFVNP